MEKLEAIIQLIGEHLVIAYVDGRYRLFGKSTGRMFGNAGYLDVAIENAWTFAVKTFKKE